MNPRFNVVIAYEDFETGKHAKKTYDFLGENLGTDCELDNQMWKFDVLGIPKLAEIAARDAAAADIMIVSCHGQGELPEAVTSWIESWVAETRNLLALVVLFDSPGEESGFDHSGIRSYLADVARRAGVEFFAQPDRAHSHDSNSRLINGSEFAGRTLNTLAGAVQRDVSYRHWGINE